MCSDDTNASAEDYHFWENTFSSSSARAPTSSVVVLNDRGNVVDET